MRLAAKTAIVQRDANPQWDETFAIIVPSALRQVPFGDLFLHIKLWDHDNMASDQLVAQAAVSLGSLPHHKSRRTKPMQLHAIGEPRMLEARLYVAASRGEKAHVSIRAPDWHSK